MLPQGRIAKGELVAVLGLTAVLAVGCASARSSGSTRVALPRVVGDRVPAAKARLAAVGLGAITLSQFSSSPRGVVISQGQPAGARVVRGATVALTVSAGAAHSVMPQLAGARAGAATARLQRLRLAVLTFTVFSDAPRGTVVSTFPAAGTSVPYDAQARVDVSGGPPPGAGAPVRVPALTGLDGPDAQARLRGRWLVPDVFYVRSSSPGGSVVRQTVAPGSRARLGSLVGLALAGTATTPVPYVVGRPSAVAAGLLRSTGFHVRVVSQPAAAAVTRGSVIDEQPMGGTKAPAHAVVTIVIAA